MACYLLIDHNLQKRDAVSQTDKILQSYHGLCEGGLLLGSGVFLLHISRCFRMYDQSLCCNVPALSLQQNTRQGYCHSQRRDRKPVYLEQFLALCNLNN